MSTRTHREVHRGVPHGWCPEEGTSWGPWKGPVQQYLRLNLPRVTARLRSQHLEARSSGRCADEIRVGSAKREQGRRARDARGKVGLYQLRFIHALISLFRSGRAHIAAAIYGSFGREALLTRPADALGGGLLVPGVVEGRRSAEQIAAVAGGGVCGGVSGGGKDESAGAGGGRKRALGRGEKGGVAGEEWAPRRAGINPQTPRPPDSQLC